MSCNQQDFHPVTQINPWSNTGICVFSYKINNSQQKNYKDAMDEKKPPGLKQRTGVRLQTLDSKNNWQRLVEITSNTPPSAQIKRFVFL